MAKLVSKVYGDALFETAMEKELVDTLYEETSALLPILQANPELFSASRKSADRKRREGCLITSGLFRKDCGGADGLLEHHC